MKSKHSTLSEQQPQAQSSLSHIPTQSWYPPSVLSPTPSLSRASTSNVNTPAGASPLSKSDSAAKPSKESGPFPQSPSTVSPTSAFASTFPPLRDKSVEELRKLLTDKEAYNGFLHSLDQVKTLDTLQGDLKRSNIELARKNLEWESRITELQTQCSIIRTTELAGSRERNDEAKRQQNALINRLNGSAFLEKLQEAADVADDESEKLHQQLLAGDMELMEFIPKYRKLRVLYHRRALTYLAAKSSV